MSSTRFPTITEEQELRAVAPSDQGGLEQGLSARRIYQDSAREGEPNGSRAEAPSVGNFAAGGDHARDLIGSAHHIKLFGEARTLARPYLDFRAWRCLARGRALRVIRCRGRRERLAHGRAVITATTAAKLAATAVMLAMSWTFMANALKMLTLVEMKSSRACF